MGRNSDARSKLLASAQALMEVRGYSAIGVAEICKAAGVLKGSFYYFFDSKEALALAVLDEQWRGQRAAWAAALRGDEPPLTRLRGLVEVTENVQHTAQQRCGTISGCLFGNLTLELSNQAEAVRGRLQEIFEAQLDMVEEVIAEAHTRGDVRVGDTRGAARAVVAQLEGQIMFAKLHNSTQCLDSLWHNCLALLGAHDTT
jgi:TetR/AcrR family transcriptional regulator, transcriptional repressor for nem operon